MALIEGIVDGTVDAIATDHAPHTTDEKGVELENTPNGIVGLETAVGLSYTELVTTGLITLARLIELMSINPRKILSIPIPSFQLNSEADITFLAPEESWVVNPIQFRSNCSNMPFAGRRLNCRPVGIYNRSQFVLSTLGK